MSGSCGSCATRWRRERGCGSSRRSSTRTRPGPRRSRPSCTSWTCTCWSCSRAASAPPPSTPPCSPRPASTRPSCTPRCALERGRVEAPRVTARRTPTSGWRASATTRQARLALLRELYEVPRAVDRGYLPLPPGGVGVHGLAAASGTAEPGVRPGARQPVVARGERDAAEGHLRGLGARLRPRRCIRARPGVGRHPRRSSASRRHAPGTAPTTRRSPRRTWPTRTWPASEGACRAVLHQPRARPRAVRARPRRRATAGPRPAGTCGPAARRSAARHDRHLPVPRARAPRSTTPSTTTWSGTSTPSTASATCSTSASSCRRLGRLYDWSAGELGLPGLRALLDPPGPTPAYAWDPQDGRGLAPDAVPARAGGPSCGAGDTLRSGVRMFTEIR